MHRPNVLFLCETKASEERMKKLTLSIGFSEHLAIGAKRKAGGVCMMWSNSLDVKVLEFNLRTIAVKINDSLCSWALIGFYGPPYQAQQRNTWLNLHALLQSIDIPWVCVGDFNVVTEKCEKVGGHGCGTSAPNFLKDLLFDLGAVDLGFSGCKFTWWNKRWGKGSIQERLDRAIASFSWKESFPKAAVSHLGAVNSDHTPILMDSSPEEEFLPRPFRFQAIWTRDPRCGEVIKEAWTPEVSGSPSFKLVRKQSNTTMALQKWNKNVFRLCQSKIKELSGALEEIQKKDMSFPNAQRESQLQGELNEWMARNKILWRQKLREMWLKDGDKNSKFFHLSTIIRCRRNSIDVIKDDDGNWITNYSSCV